MGLFEILETGPQRIAKPRSGGRSKPSSGQKLGCQFCPRNNIPGIQKIFGSVEGKPLFLWVQSPGADENAEGRELVGRAGRWLWQELKQVGIRRPDCDIQNVVRCWPADRDDEENRWVARDPLKEELKCCSMYTKQAIAQSKARVWLVMGQIAREQLFGKKKRASTFYQGQTRVFLADHPAYFIRGTASKSRLDQFRETLRLVKEELNNKGGRFSFIQTRDYRAIKTGKEALQAAREILELARSGERIVYDEEDDVIDGKRVLLCVGASGKPGTSYVFVLDHPENQVSESEKQGVREVVKSLLKHPHPKGMHHGNYDIEKYEELLGVKTENFDFDTQYGEYMRDPTQHGYNLSAIVERNLPKYSGYKDIVQEAVPEGMTVEQGREIGEFHLARVPLQKVIWYNGGDCDVTKQTELGAKDKVPLALVRVYTDAAFSIDEMQQNGPLFDYSQYEKVIKIYPRRQDGYRSKLRLLTEDPDLNPNSQPQMLKAIYEKWGIEPVSDREAPNTAKETLELIQARALMETREYHPGITALQDYREAKNRVERIHAFKRSADAHLGRVITYWWLTGARTGRLSSGGGLRVDKENLGNLQNIPSDDIVKNMLISSLQFREFYRRASEGMTRRSNSEGKEIWVLPHLEAAIREFEDIEIFVASDYSQMELRIVAQMTGDRELVRIFQSGEDVHASIGSLWTGWSKEEIINDEDKRRLVKAFHFSVVYGKKVHGLYLALLAAGVNTTEEEVQTYHENYFKKMTGVRDLIEDLPAFAEENGYVENLFGFRVPINVSQEKAKGEAYWKNQTINSPVQGAAHQVLLIAFALKKRRPELYGLIRPQMEIHDALIGGTPLKRLRPTIDSMNELMVRDAPKTAEEEFKFKWKVPFQVEHKIGFRYGGLEKVKGSLTDTLKRVIVKIKTQDEDLSEFEKEIA